MRWSKCLRKDGTSLMHVCACACMCADEHAYILTRKVSDLTSYDGAASSQEQLTLG